MFISCQCLFLYVLSLVDPADVLNIFAGIAGSTAAEAEAEAEAEVAVEEEAETKEVEADAKVVVPDLPDVPEKAPDLPDAPLGEGTDALAGEEEGEEEMEAVAA